MRKRTILIAGAALSACFANSAFAASRLVLDDADIAKVVSAATAAIDKQHQAGCIAITDQDGGLLYLQRLHDAPAACVDVSIAKARTAAMFRTASANFAKRAASGEIAVARLPNALPFAGGVPLAENGTVVGAIGISTPVGALDQPVAEEAAKVFP